MKSLRCALEAILLLITASQLISAQSPDTFEVASIKPSRPGARFSGSLDAAQFFAPLILFCF